MMSDNIEKPDPSDQHLYNYGGLYDTNTAAGPLKPMPDKHRDAIRKVHVLLVQDLDVTDVMDHMIQSGIINDHKRDVILAKLTRQDRVRTFLDILMRSGSNAMGVFLESLKESYIHLWDTMQKQLQAGDKQNTSYLEYINCDEIGNEYEDVLSRINATETEEIYGDVASANTAQKKSDDDYEGYVTGIAQKVSEDVCQQNSPTITMVCRETCSARVISTKTTGFSLGFNNFLERPLPLVPTDDDEATEESDENGADGNSEEQESVTISSGEFLFLEETESHRIHQSAKPNSMNVCVWDKFCRLLELPFQALKMYGDPFGEPWFYPIPFSSQQADLILRPYRKPGVFLVYRPVAVFQSHPNDNIVFNLSMVACQGNLYTVVHYHIKGGAGGRVTMFDQISFTCIQDLVAYYRANRGRLPCRLRFPPRDADRCILPGEHYDIKWHIEKDSLDWPSDDSASVWEGEFSKVMEASKDNIPVAVKFQSPSQRVDPWSLEQFFEEAMIMTKMDHKNVVQLQGFSLSKTPFFVMEYHPAGSLLQALKNKQVDQDFLSILSMFKQVIQALEYLESLMFVIHCDVASRNILIGEGNCLKLADFGLARMVTEDGFFAEENTKLPFRHAAPEVLKRGWFSTKSDIWSAGVVLWEMLTDGNTPPYGKHTSAQIFKFLYSVQRLSCPYGHSPITQTFFKNITTLCWRMNEIMRPSASELLDVVNSHPKEIHDSQLQPGESTQSIQSLDAGPIPKPKRSSSKKGTLLKRIKWKGSSKS